MKSIYAGLMIAAIACSAPMQNAARSPQVWTADPQQADVSEAVFGQGRWKGDSVIQPEISVHQFDPEQAPNSWRLMARITAHTHRTFWFVNAPMNESRYVVDSGGTQRVVEGTFAYCKHGEASPVALAAFAPIHTDTYKSGCDPNTKLGLLNAAYLVLDRQMTWVTCGSGCCNGKQWVWTKQEIKAMIAKLTADSSLSHS